MRRLLVFQHAANEILGTLLPLLKKHRFRIRHVNFDRSPHSDPNVDKYDGLIVLGGNMSVYESDRYPHITHELKLIEKAMMRGIPILGICLGSQLIAQVLGGKVKKHSEVEAGWCKIQLTFEGTKDPLFHHFQPEEYVFQMHGDTFELPQKTERLASSALCPNQAFRYEKLTYALQFHLEVDTLLIQRWLQSPNTRDQYLLTDEKVAENSISSNLEKLARSQKLSEETFLKFIELFPHRNKDYELLGTEHAAQSRKNP